MRLESILNQVYPLRDSSILALESITREVVFPKGHLLIRADKVEPNLYLIKKGVLRAYSNNGESETTFWFGKEGDIVISMKSYVAREKGYEDIELLEDSQLYEVPIERLQQLYSDDIQIANWGRKFAEKELIKTEERLISRQFQSATQRYRDLMLHHPDLLQRVQLGHIASYLGITQVSLSRIRSSIAL